MTLYIISSQYLQLPRLPQTKQLSLVGLDFTLTVSTLNTCNCPLLQVGYKAEASDYHYNTIKRRLDHN